MKRAACALIFLLASTGYAYAQAASPQVIEFGDWGSAILNWALAVFGPAIAAMLIALLYKMLAWFNYKLEERAREKLQEIVVNGINLFGTHIDRRIQGNYSIETKNKLTYDVLNYVKTHGVPTLRMLGVDVNDPNLPQAIEARVEKALNDPLAPTPPQLTPPEVLSMGRTRSDSTTGTDGVEQRSNPNLTI